MHRKIAIPVKRGALSPHFGHCEHFAIIEINDGRIIGKETHVPPEHAPGLYPQWIAGLGVSDIIVSGIGKKAIALFNDHKINVFLGAPLKSPEIIAEDFLCDALSLSANTCNHDTGHTCQNNELNQ